MFANACARGLEGIVSKRRDLPYQSGRGGGWVKTKCVQRQELVIGGFTEPEGARVGVGALLVGYQGDGGLVFAGKVGTGFSSATSLDLRRRLEPLIQRTSPFTTTPLRGVHYVAPRLVAEVEFTEWTDDGHIRHPSFKGLRADKQPPEVVRERPTVAISNPDRVLFPELGLTKAELCAYLETVADRMLPHVAGRPLTLYWCPKGIAAGCQFLRHSKVWGPAALRRVKIQEKTKIGEYLIADDLAGLVALGQMDVIEIHPWNARFEHLEQPDRIILDLDPGPDVAWKDVVAVARRCRAAFRDVGLETLVKTTGGDGLHVVAPIRPEHDVAACLAFSRALAERIAADDPRRLTTSLPKAGRAAKILLDYLRNNRTNTAVAPYSPRARPHAPVSMPVAWDELTARLRPARFTMRTIAARLKQPDPWAEYAALGAQRLTP
jgi:bifunctional non-homologous end joining protein LigD